jgi:hypothetical protein
LKVADLREFLHVTKTERASLLDDLLERSAAPRIPLAGVIRNANAAGATGLSEGGQESRVSGGAAVQGIEIE